MTHPHKKIYLFISLSYLLLLAFFNFHSRVTIYPEIYLQSWLVYKGLVPFRDFFEHHGFLLYYLLSPLLVDNSFGLLKLFYYLIQFINLALILSIIKKHSSLFGFLLAGLFSVLMYYYLSENLLWYEQFTALIYLVIYILTTLKKTPRNIFLVGLLVVLASFIKVISGIILIPLFMYYKDIRLVIFFSIAWFAALAYFYFNHALTLLIRDLFFYNIFLSKNLPKFFSFDRVFLASLCFIFIISLFFIIKEGLFKKYFLILSFVLFPLSFNTLVFSHSHFLIVGVFLTILLSRLMAEKGGIIRYFLVIFLSILSLFLLNKIRFQIWQSNVLIQPWQEDTRNIQLSKEYKKLHDRGNIYIVDNHVTSYVILDKLPPTSFPFQYPLMDKFIPGYEKILISNLQKNKVKYIFYLEPIEKEYTDLKNLNRYIQDHYKELIKGENYKILVEKPSG